MKIVTLLVASGFICVALPAEAGVCTKEIEMITQLLSGGGTSSGGSVAPAAPSTSALSSAVGGGGAAAPAASPEALEAVEEAKTADAAGDEASCMDYIGKAKELLGLVQ
jgi:hypothetical protein